MPRLSARRRALLLTTALVIAAVSLPAQQMVTETRDPAQTQDEEFASVGQGVDDAAVLHQSAGRSPAEGQRRAGSEGRARLSHRRARQADLLRGHPEVLQGAGGRGAGTRAGRDDRRSDEDRELVVVWISSDENITNLQNEPREPRAHRGSPRELPRADPAARRDDEATLPPDGGLHSGETGPPRC